MLDDIQRDLRNLIDLVRRVENYDATLAARPDIVPVDAARIERKRREVEIIRLITS